MSDIVNLFRCAIYLLVDIFLWISPVNKIKNKELGTGLILFCPVFEISQRIQMSRLFTLEYL